MRKLVIISDAALILFVFSICLIQCTIYALIVLAAFLLGLGIHDLLQKKTLSGEIFLNGYGYLCLIPPRISIDKD